MTIGNHHYVSPEGHLIRIVERYKPSGSYAKAREQFWSAYQWVGDGWVKIENITWEFIKTCEYLGTVKKERFGLDL